MFDFVSKHKRLIQLLLALVAVPFLFFGMESYTRVMRSADEVARVNGEPIAQREFSDALRQQQDRLRAVFGQNFDVAALDTREARLAVLDSLIAQRVVADEVAANRLIMSKNAAIAEIVAAPEFQEGGKFSAERYSNYLRARGLSDEANVAMLRLQLPTSRLIGAVTGSAILSREVASRLLALESQRREVSEAILAPEQYLGQVKADEAQLKAYYEANRKAFGLPERVRAEYLVLSAEALGRAEPASDAELKALYEARAAQLGTPEQRRVSHILVKTRDAAEKLLAELRTSPARFEALAKQHSLDAGSAEKGGDLGPVGRGDVVKPFADAVFALKEGEIAGPVETEFGFHVVRVSAVQPGRMRAFDEVKAALAAELAEQKGKKRFAEAADGFNNLVYEQSDSLAPAAERYKLKLQTSGWIARGSAAQAGPLGHPKLLAALFSPDAVKERRNTDAVEVSPGVLIAARVLEHQPATERAFEEVKAEVETRYRREEATKLARKDGEAKLAALRKGEDAGAKWSTAKSVSRLDPQGIEKEALAKIMQAAPDRLPAFVGVPLGSGGYALYRVAKLLAGEPRPESERTAELQRLERDAGQEQLDAYVGSLRARAEIEIRSENLERKDR
jgi:peptidyl-prolyl cis-trans isomerase D